MKKILLGVVLASSYYINAEDTFTLGEISITDKQDTVLDITKISNDTLQSMPQKDIAKVLDTQAGVTIEHKGGREESSLMIRGLEASRTGIFVDGISINNPYDGNFDYSRYLSTNLTSVSIAKGFSSVLFGPNTMSGVVNFVTKKPTKEFEGSFSSQMNTDNDFTKSQTINALSLGSKQEKYYFQFNGTLQDRDHWNLSEDYEATALQEEGARGHSDSDSKSFNLKVGYTPNDTLEYVLGVNYIDSTKSQPTTVDADDSTEKYINWPKFDSNSVYFMVNKKFQTSALKFKLYRTDYENTYEEYSDDTYSTLDSLEYTDASTIGTGLEYAEYGWSDEHIVKFGVNFKQDTYEIEREAGSNSGADDKFVENVYSLAVEDIYQPTDKLKIISSMSYDYADPTEAITYGTDLSEITPYSIVKSVYVTNENSSYSLQSNDAINAQVGFFYDFIPNQTTRFTVARKTHLPTLKERFSDKKSKAEINPFLTPEIAMHYEIGHNIKQNNFALDTALFYIDVKDPIRQVLIGNTKSDDSGKDVYQEQNTGEENFKGFETTLKYEKDAFTIGANYTYTKIKKDDDSIIVTDVPKHQAYFYASYTPVSYLTFSGNISYKKDFILEDANENYISMPDTTVAGVNIDYRYSKALSFAVGIENLTDEDYELDLGYPEPGREYYAKFTYNF
jgi:iron complex outermembrane receptor protein